MFEVFQSGGPSGRKGFGVGQIHLQLPAGLVVLADLAGQPVPVGLQSPDIDLQVTDPCLQTVPLAGEPEQAHGHHAVEQQGGYHPAHAATSPAA
ncbi:hypothetical protein LH426_11820 [Laribacter hongkongensis]|uniref:hypothetical protein n=1 Tax=Laribacter hongkongensis TaxID=168471 RepID=UPI0028210C0A|nr:hypothetical protein [Laribacter hongkongensis]